MRLLLDTHIAVWAALDRFNGMFAFALWDRQERLLCLARDRMGEKPLYYGWSGGVFLFGSELKALRQHPGWTPRIRPEAVATFLRHSYIPAPDSVYEGVYKLEPGTILTLPFGGDPRIEHGVGDVHVGKPRSFAGTPATRRTALIVTRVCAFVKMAQSPHTGARNRLKTGRAFTFSET